MYQMFYLHFRNNHDFFFSVSSSNQEAVARFIMNFSFLPQKNE